MSPPGPAGKNQEELHQAYLDASAKLKQMTRGGADRKDLERQRLDVERAKAIWHRTVQQQRGAARRRG